MKPLNKTILNFAITSLAFAAFAAQAQTAAPATPAAPAASGVELSYNLGVVTDYRYRGVSQTRLKPAVQGGFDAVLGGAYFGVWASNIKWVKDAGGNGNAEVDLYGGYKYEASKNFTLDVGVLAYQYPKNNLTPSANTTELYIGGISGPFSAKYSRSTSNLFGFSASKGSGYLEANLDYEVAKGTNLVLHVGKQTIKNNSASSYTDYKIGATYEALGGKLAASIVGASENFPTPNGKNLGKAGLVLGYTKTF
jgi:uncharacterized protein (TIGR02001 family)